MSEQHLRLGGHLGDDFRRWKAFVDQADRFARVNADVVGSPLRHGRQIGRTGGFGGGPVLGLAAGPSVDETVSQDASGEFGRPGETRGDVRGDLADRLVAARRDGVIRSASIYAGRHLARKQVSARLIPA